MAITIRLKKPLYKWQYDRPNMGSGYALRPDVQEWLEETRVGYRCFSSEETNADGRTLLYYNIKIDDEPTALLFKLTWL